jgi:hypothetical protein
MKSKNVVGARYEMPPVVRAHVGALDECLDYSTYAIRESRSEWGFS